MSSEPNLDSDKVVPLSQANLSRKPSNYLEISEERLKEILSEAIDRGVSTKLSRLENSINRMVNQFEAVRNGEAEDAALRVTTNLEAVDIALSGIHLPKEQYYSYTCGHLAEILDIKIHEVVRMIKELGLRGDAKYHYCITTGKKSAVNKWSEATLQKLKEYLTLKQREQERQNS